MEQITLNTYKAKRSLGCILILASLFTLLFFGPLGLYISKEKNSKDAYTNSIVDIAKYQGSKKYYAPLFYYNVNGEEYTCLSRAHSVYFSIPKESKIYYDSQNPSSCISEYEVSLTYEITKIIALMTLPIFLIGLIISLSLLATKLKIKKLKKNGQLIKGLPCRIKNSSFGIMDLVGFYIQIDYKTKEGTVLALKSDIKYHKHIVNIGKADLLINPINPNEYYIDFNITNDNVNNY